jgi:hypothetical protein
MSNIFEYPQIFMIVGVIILIRFILFYANTQINQFGEVIKENAKPPEEKQDIVKFIKEKYDLSISPEQEKKVKIDQLWLYPVRGVRGIEVDHVELTPYGIKYDRNWVIIDLVKMKSVANHNSHLITFLRQEIIDDKEGKKLRLYL